MPSNAQHPKLELSIPTRQQLSAGRRKTDELYNDCIDRAIPRIVIAHIRIPQSIALGAKQRRPSRDARTNVIPENLMKNEPVAPLEIG